MFKQLVRKAPTPKVLSHDTKQDKAYSAGYNDGKAGNVFRFTSLLCVCAACRETYKMGFEFGQIARTATDE